MTKWTHFLSKKIFIFIFFDKLINKNLFTNNNISHHDKKSLLKAYVKSISSKSFIENIEFIDENIREEKDKYLFKKNLSFENYFKELRSKNNSIFEKKLPLNTDFESQTSNELIEEIRLVDLKSLKLNQNSVFHSFWSLRFAISCKSDLQSPLKSKTKIHEFLITEK